MAKQAWVEKLSENLNSLVGEETRKKIMEGYDLLTKSSSPAKKAQWVKSAMEKLDQLVDKKTRTKIMENCACVSNKSIEKAKNTYKQSENLDDFLTKLQKERIAGTKLLREGDIIYAFYDKCYCGRVKATKEKISSTYCHCSKGYLKKIFEAVFQKSLKIDILQTILQGNQECKFAIHIN